MGSAPFIADDFMYPGTREKRVLQAKRDKIEVDRLNQQLQSIDPGTAFQWAIAKDEN